MVKFFIPVLEISIAFGALYFLPEGLFRIGERIFGGTDGGLVKFVLENVRGYLFGTAIALTFFSQSGCRRKIFSQISCGPPQALFDPP